MKKKRNLWLCVPILLVLTSQYNAYKIITEGYHIEPIYLWVIYLSILSIHKWGKDLFQKIPLKPIALMVAVLYLPQEIFINLTNKYNTNSFKNTKHYLKIFNSKKGVL